MPFLKRASALPWARAQFIRHNSYPVALFRKSA
jgi:hypothetical protein